MADHLSLGDLIRRQREKLGLTQARLAELVGRSPSTVRSWERDRSLPGDEDALSALGAVLGLTDDDLREALGGAYPSFDAPLPLQPTPPPADASAVSAPVDGLAQTKTEIPAEPAPPADERPAPSQEATAPIDDVEVGGDSTGEASTSASEDVPVEEEGASDVDEEGASNVEAAPVTEPPGGTTGRPDGVTTRQEVVESTPPARPEPYPAGSPFVSQSTVSAPPRVPSYMDDPGEARMYRLRAILTAVILVLMFLVLTWAFGQAGDALGSLFGS